jgi:hypothetical protein
MTIKRHDLPARVLFGLGIYDLIRGVMHTVLLRWSGIHVAGFDPSTTPVDQFFMLGAFGISNLLTGCLFLLISRRAPELSAWVLGIIPATYLAGLLGIRSSGVYGTLTYGGQYLMYVYFAICIGTLLIHVAERMKTRRD